MITYEVQIPENVELAVSGATVTVRGKLGELKRDFEFRAIKQQREPKRLVLTSEATRKEAKAAVGTIAAHIKNMIDGVTKGYEYRLKTVYAHFPINVSVEGQRVVIKNFAGEKTPRYSDILPGTKVEVKGQEISVRGINVESVGQTAANIEAATRVRGKDARVFQDGIYIVSKNEG
jgi:large subunit ribosomal protein L6